MPLSPLQRLNCVLVLVVMQRNEYYLACVRKDSGGRLPVMAIVAAWVYPIAVCSEILLASSLPLETYEIPPYSGIFV